MVQGQGALVHCERARVENRAAAGGGGVDATRKISHQRASVHRQIPGVVNAATAQIIELAVAINNGERGQHHGGAARHVEQPRESVASDLNAAGQRLGINGDGVVQRQLAADQRKRRAGQVCGKGDGVAGRGTRNELAQRTGAAVHRVGDDKSGCLAGERGQQRRAQQAD